jgi:hypothetical protein
MMEPRPEPWIDVNGAAVDAIIEQVKRCHRVH